MIASNRSELQRAIKELDLPETDFRILSREDGLPIIQQIEERFVKQLGLRWWWEAFQGASITSVHFKDGTGWYHIADIVPSTNGLIWFIVEDRPGFILCQGKVEAIQAVIGECWAFEYYIISQNLDWLVAENHHDVVIAVGEPVAGRLIAEANQALVKDSRSNPS